MKRQFNRCISVTTRCAPVRSVRLSYHPRLRVPGGHLYATHDFAIIMGLLDVQVAYNTVKSNRHRPQWE